MNKRKGDNSNSEIDESSKITFTKKADETEDKVLFSGTYAGFKTKAQFKDIKQKLEVCIVHV